MWHFKHDYKSSRLFSLCFYFKRSKITLKMVKQHHHHHRHIANQFFRLFIFSFISIQCCINLSDFIYLFVGISVRFFVASVSHLLHHRIAINDIDSRKWGKISMKFGFDRFCLIIGYEMVLYWQLNRFDTLSVVRFLFWSISLLAWRVFVPFKFVLLKHSNYGIFLMDLVHDGSVAFFPLLSTPVQSVHMLY